MYPDEEQFLEALFRQNYSTLVIYARSLLNGAGDPEEVVQESFRIASDKIAELIASQNPVGWMKLTVKNTVRNLHRRRNRELQIVLPLAALQAEPGACDQTTQDLLLYEQCRSLLSEQDFALVYGIVIEGIAYAELAKQQGITLWSCYKKVKRALKKLEQGFSTEASENFSKNNFKRSVQKMQPSYIKKKEEVK